MIYSHLHFLVPVTFVDYYRADYRPVSPATLPEHYQFYFVFLRESLSNADVSTFDLYSNHHNMLGLPISFDLKF